MLIIATSFRKEYDSKTNLSLFIDSYHFLCGKGLKPSIGVGSYKGEEELSFSFHCSKNHPSYPYVLRHFLEERKQDCIMFVKENNEVFMQYQRGFEGSFFGIWEEVSKEKAINEYGDFSCFNGSYYVVS